MKKRTHKSFIKIKGNKEQAERIRSYIPVIDYSEFHVAESYKKECCKSFQGRQDFKEEVEKKKASMKKTIRRGK